MSHARSQPFQEPVKWKLRLFNFTFLPDKPCEIFACLARISLSIILIFSILLALYITFITRQTQTNWLRIPTNANRNDPDQNSNPTNISHILFGIAGSASTWQNRKQYSSIWWNRNLTRGHVWLDEPPPDNDADAPPYKVSSEEWTKFKYSSSRSAVRIARIISDSYRTEKLREKVRWFVMGDDDTVYFWENLVSVLGKYDCNKMWYIGGNSESVEQNVLHSYGMAFGGGGFAISYALADKLVKLLDGCLDRYFYFYGSDQRIWACLSEIGVGLTLEPGFHQFDIRGNPYGILAAHPRAPLVSLHHLDYLDPLFPNKNRIDSVKSLHDAYALDPARILQQTFCHDYKRKWSISIGWGYTIQLYSSLLPAKDLQTPFQTFKTWRTSADGPFTFNTRPIPSDPCKQPIIFMLEQAKAVGERGTITTYNRTVTEPSGNTCNSTEHSRAMSVQRIDVSSMKLDPAYWTEAPRRQCCDFIDAGRKVTGGLRVRIRNCRPWETVTT